jgi:hypothetical protein
MGLFGLNKGEGPISAAIPPGGNGLGSVKKNDMLSTYLFLQDKINRFQRTLLKSKITDVSYITNFSEHNSVYSSLPMVHTFLHIFFQTFSILYIYGRQMKTES